MNHVINYLREMMKEGHVDDVIRLILHCLSFHFRMMSLSTCSTLMTTRSWKHQRSEPGTAALLLAWASERGTVGSPLEWASVPGTVALPPAWASVPGTAALLEEWASGHGTVVS